MPNCRPPLYVRDNDKESPSYGRSFPKDGYQPCPSAINAPAVHIDFERQAAIVARAYGTGPAAVPPPSEPVLTDEGRIAVMAWRESEGFQIGRPDDPWLPGNAPAELAVTVNQYGCREELTLSSEARRRVLEEAEREAEAALVAPLDEEDGYDVEADLYARNVNYLMSRKEVQA